MKKIISIFFTFIFLVCVPQSVFAETNKSEKVPCQVIRVVDGDTIKVNYNGKEESVRMIGIDCPESVHPDTTKNTDAGFAASEYTTVMLQNKTVELEFDVAKRDHYGRLLAYVYINGEMLNTSLIEKGYANIATYPPNIKYVDIFKAAQSNRPLDVPTGIYYDGYMLAPNCIYNTTEEQNHLGSSFMFVDGIFQYIGSSTITIDNTNKEFSYYFIKTEKGFVYLIAEPHQTIQDNISVGKKGYICFQYLTYEETNRLPVGIYYEYTPSDKITTNQNPLANSTQPDKTNSANTITKTTRDTQSKQISEPTTNQQVYITATGSRYHYENPCGRGTYYATTLDKAKRSGLTACNKCVY